MKTHFKLVLEFEKHFHTKDERAIKDELRDILDEAFQRYTPKSARLEYTNPKKEVHVLKKSES